MTALASTSAEPILWLADGLVRHERLRPAHHAFAYRVAFLRVRIDRLVGARLPRWVSHNRFNLFSLYDRDYLAGDAPLVQRIRALLSAHGVRDADGAIWLHTFPRILGYAFNPVSFWFCERADGGLRAIVAEVNNTFGERHCYLLAHDDARAIVDGETLRARKVFHVSPFCAVEGDYAFRFANRSAHGRPMRSVARIDYRDAQGDLLLTSISGDLSPATSWSVLAAWFRHPIMTIAIVARIHMHAVRLWLKRVPFFRKPSPPEATVTR